MTWKVRLKAHSGLFELARRTSAFGVSADAFMSTWPSSAFSNKRARLFEFVDHLPSNRGRLARAGDTTRDALSTIGIIGNSQCELELGRGALIDQHDLVMRFKLFSTSDEFSSDYEK